MFLLFRTYEVVIIVRVGVGKLLHKIVGVEKQNNSNNFVLKVKTILTLSYS